MNLPLARTGLITFLGALLLFVIVACSRQEQKTAPPAKPPVPVTLGTATLRSVPLELTAFGTVEARSTVAIKSKVSGDLLKVHIREGDEVRQGDLLFTIDPRPFELAVQQAAAVLNRDRIQAANAKQKAERYRQLLDGKYVSPQEYEQLATEAEALASVVGVDQAALDHARLQLDYCRIRAPLAGRTGRVTVDPGSLVKGNDGEALVTIHQLAPIDVVFSLPEKELPRLHQMQGDKALLVSALLDKGTGLSEPGVLDFIDNSVDPATGTVRVKATFANAGRRLWPGAFVRVVLQLGPPRQLLAVPSGAVQIGQQGSYVYVVGADHSATVRPVQVGSEWQGMTVIVAGLTAGEAIVVDGQSRLYPGAKVATVPPAAPPKP